jgi:hypothetical protein
MHPGPQTGHSRPANLGDTENMKAEMSEVIKPNDGLNPCRNQHIRFNHLLKLAQVCNPMERASLFLWIVNRNCIS